MKLLKWLSALLFVTAIGAFIVAYWLLSASLPSLNDQLQVTVSASTTLERDKGGTVIINAKNERDAAFALGYAHAQDRLFQIDLLRRQSAGELSALVGKAALQSDKNNRIHQFRQRANTIMQSLPAEQLALLEAYTQGVNEAANKLSGKPFEYYLLNNDFAPWQSADSLLVIFSMYVDLQRSQTEIDFSLTALQALYGNSMLEFFMLPSNYQAAIDYSVVKSTNVEVPLLQRNPTPKNTDNDSTQPVLMSNHHDYSTMVAPPDYGSNNWAVSGQLTQSKSAMLSNDMHLGLRVPAIWYKAQLNYATDNQNVQVTGVSLPGTPGIIVGATKDIAWGFTNANVDNADWILLDKNTTTTKINEIIEIASSESISFEIEMSEYGPVRRFNGKRYALKWVAHQDYAVNLTISDMSKQRNIDDALELAKQVRMPVQNMVVADANGNIAWQLTGAVTARTALSRHAITEVQYSALWAQAETNLANVTKPENQRVWSANARVTGLKDLARFGDGGYALGARQQQIMLQLMQQNMFSEQDFYDLQLDNRALFLMPWHALLTDILSNSPQLYKKDLEVLNAWQACACPESIGYTLVRKFRSTVINQLLAPISTTLKEHEVSSSYLLRGIEPAIWVLLQEQTNSWLPENFDNYDNFITSAYTNTKTKLFEQYEASNDDMTPLQWGKVNKLKVKHPFSEKLGLLSGYFDMPEILGFGDSYMPAVQAGSFGASQRLIVRPGNLESAILTIPGGQSGHVLSPFYKVGFNEYAEQDLTRLMPGEPKFKIEFTPIN